MSDVPYSLWFPRQKALTGKLMSYQNRRERRSRSRGKTGMRGFLQLRDWRPLRGVRTAAEQFYVRQSIVVRL